MKPKLSILDPNPTPLQYLSGLSQELFREIYIKRDDLTPFGGGGNKLRKLEYLMIEALNSQATTIVTVGGPQTNHGRLTAAVAAKFGLKCIIVAVGDTDGELSGNLLLDGIFGARVVLKHDDGRDQDVQLEETVKKVMAAELKKGEQVYFIPMGGSDTTGMLAIWTVPANSMPRPRNSRSTERRSMSPSAAWHISRLILRPESHSVELEAGRDCRHALRYGKTEGVLPAG